MAFGRPSSCRSSTSHNTTPSSSPPPPFMCRPDTTRNEQTLCAYPNCKRTVWQDADGVFSSYCGASHRDAMTEKLPEGHLCQVKQCTPTNDLCRILTVENLFSSVRSNRNISKMGIVCGIELSYRDLLVLL